jgi:hypothetical protein
MHSKAQYILIKAQSAQSNAQSAPCVPVPDHMLCYPFHVIGYWRKSKPILPKYSIQNAI